MNTLSTYVPRKLSAPVMARLYAKMAEEVRKEEAAKARKAK